MKFDATKLPLGEGLIGVVLVAVLATFVLAFAFAPGTGLEQGAAEEEAALEPWERGQKIAESFACTTCHSTTGEVVIGPSWLNLYGGTVTLDDGTEVVVDEAYVQESILNPPAKLVQGFSAVMPTFSGITDENIQDLIAFMATLSENAPAATPTPEGTPEATPTP
jgi:cytochrome c oxidase subunit 2